MFNRDDEYKNATKDARINVNTNNMRDESIKLWLVNISLLSLLVVGSYYSYLYFNKNKSRATAVMGVTHINTSDYDLMLKLNNVEVEKEKVTIEDAINNIIDETVVEENSNPYIEKLAKEIDNNSKTEDKKNIFEKRISDELKSIN